MAILVFGPDGVRPVDAASFPAEYRPFSLAHAGGFEILQGHADEQGLDWVWLAPAGDFDHGAGRTGRYVVRPHGDPSARVSYADFAIALLNQIDPPADAATHHRTVADR